MSANAGGGYSLLLTLLSMVNHCKWAIAVNWSLLLEPLDDDSHQICSTIRMTLHLTI